MAGIFLLAGGGEFQKGMEAADRFALETAAEGGSPGTFPLCLVLAVASGQRKAEELARDGSVWLSKQGAGLSEGLPVLDRSMAEDQTLAEKVRAARLVYLVGGDPAYIPGVLQGTALFEALKAAHREGAVVAGSGSGAMALTEYLYHEETGQVVAGLDLIPDACVIPYHGSKGRKWSKQLSQLLPTAYLFGLDEKTAMIGEGNRWQVYGRSWITIYKGGKPRKFVNGQPFALNPKQP